MHQNHKQASMSGLIGGPAARMDVVHQELNFIKRAL